MLMADQKAPQMQATLGLTGLTSNAMALIAPGAFLWLTFYLQATEGTTSPSMWFGIVVALLLCLATAVAYAEISKLYPGTGSSYYYAEQALLSKDKAFKYARVAKFIVGWGSHLYYWVYPGVMVATTGVFVGYVVGFLYPTFMSGSNPGPVFMALVAVVFSFFVAWIAARGAGASTAVNLAINVIQISALLVFSVLAVGYRANHPAGVPAFQYDSQTLATYSYQFQAAKDGSTVRDASGNPLPLLDKAGKPVPFTIDYPEKDASGNFLSHPTIASKRWLYRQYDHMVQHGTAVLPGSDAGVVRLRLGASEKFIAIKNDCNGRYCYLNPRRGALIAMVECLRNLVCAGATPLAMTDNLNFGNPYKPENFYQLKECVAGLAEACRFFDVPVVGGNVSLYNESPEGSIDPTPTVAVVGFIEKESHITRQFARSAGHRLVLLGGAPAGLGGSQFLGIIHGLKTGDAPAVDLAAEKRLQDLLLSQIRAGRVASAHDLSEGGLLVAISEMLFGPDCVGASVDLSRFAAPRQDALLFGESQGRVIISVAPADLPAVLSDAGEAGVPADDIGAVTAEAALSVATGLGRLDWAVSRLRTGWETSIEVAMKRPGLG